MDGGEMEEKNERIRQNDNEIGRGHRRGRRQ